MGCCKVLKTLFVLGLGLFLYKIYKCTETPELPILAENPWWGPGKPTHADIKVLPFKVQFPEEDINDLKTRLSLPYRLTTGLENSNFTYGFNAGTLKVIADYWKTKYDFSARQQKLNLFRQYKTKIEGLDIHFLHVTPKVTSGKTIVPLLLLHGWPGSVVEFDEIIPILTSPQGDRDIIFEVIAPSIPGYGFSQGPSKIGLGTPQTGQIFLKLMERLKKDKFYVQGGDWGSFIASTMATYYPKSVLGVHTNMITFMTPGVNIKYGLGAYLPSGYMLHPGDEDKMYPVSKFFSNIMREMGYLHIQATKPDTIGSALNNSPIGLAAYILEKFSSWTNFNNINEPDGALLSKNFPISLDRLLDNVSLYWFTKSITTSMRYYAENVAQSLKWRLDEIPSDVPAGFSSFKHELANHPENLAAHKYSDIVIYQRHEFGGHFAAMEVPEVLAKDIYTFVSLVIKNEQMKKKKNNEL